MIGRISLALAVLLGACSATESDGPRRPTTSGTSSSSSSTSSTTGAIGTSTGSGGITIDNDAGGSTGGGPGPCPGCTFANCPAGSKTTISGTAYAPNGTLPLYNVIAYVPAGPLKPLAGGVTCDQCGKLNSATAYATALSDAAGHFSLEGAPSGNNVPVVLQVGKWRRAVQIPEVKPCVDNPLSDPNLTRLPKSRAEGDMPSVVVTVGSSDSIACLLPKVGIDRSEFGTPGQNKAVTFYAGDGYPFTDRLTEGPPGMQIAENLWNSVSELKKYDMAILSCEGNEHREGDNKPMDLHTKNATSFAAMTEYLNAGGRIFTTDYMYTWYKFSPDRALQATATIPGGAPSGDNDITLDTSFPKGKALADWLARLNPAATYGTVQVDVVFDNYSATDPATTQVWGRGDQCIFGMCPGKIHPRFITTNTPVGKPVDQQCGKAVHLDAHIIQPARMPGATTDIVDATYPDGCKHPVSAAEQTFAFFFFDLSSCIQKEDSAPVPPPPIVK